MLVRQALLEGGYDGLFNCDANCACLVEDLMPCHEPGMFCEAGFRQPCNGTCDEGECEFHVCRTPRREADADED